MTKEQAEQLAAGLPADQRAAALQFLALSQDEKAAMWERLEQPTGMVSLTDMFMPLDYEHTGHLSADDLEDLQEKRRIYWEHVATDSRRRAFRRHLLVRRETHSARQQRPRERRPSATRTRTTRTAKAGGDPPLGDDDPPLRRPLADRGEVEDSGDTDLNLAWQAVLKHLSADWQFRHIAKLCLIRARWARWWWAR